MWSSRAFRRLLSLFSLGVLLFLGYQLWRYFTDGYSYETIYSNIVSESMRVSGVVLREEVVLSNEGLQGVPVYPVEDGTKLSRGMVFAEYYDSAQDTQNVRILRELQQKRSLLTQAEIASANTTAQADAYHQQILSQVGTLTDVIGSRNLSGLSDISDQLLVLLNVRQLTTNQQPNLNSALSTLDAQLAHYAGLISGEEKQLSASQVGYFIHATDGYESLLPYDAVRSLTPETLSQLLVSSPKPVENAAGKLMIDHKWYYACIIPMDADSDFWVGRAVTLDFHIEGARSVEATIVETHSDRDLEQTVVVFQSAFINSATVNLRFAQADVNFKLISGLWVPKQALRFEGLSQGVYVLQGNNMVFFPVTIIYEDDYYVLCESVSAADEQRYASSLKELDQVIVKGSQLYDGKPL